MAVRYREQQPTFIPPMLLAPGALPSGNAWTLEVKWDGCRAQLRYNGRSVTLRTRNARECADDFPEPAAIADVLGKRRVTLDGELVCLRSDGQPDFGRLRRRITGSTSNRHPVVLQVFDVLHLDGQSTGLSPMHSAASYSRSCRSTGLRGERRRASWSSPLKSSSRVPRNSASRVLSPSA